jgi:hypothetical protein
MEVSGQFHIQAAFTRLRLSVPHRGSERLRGDMRVFPMAGFEPQTFQPIT